MKKINFKILLALILFLSTIWLPSCAKEAQAQDKVSNYTLTDTDTTFTVKVAPANSCIISLTDSSNSSADTISVYIVSPAGDALLAALTKVNDTTANSVQVPKSTGTLILTDGAVIYYKLQVPTTYSVMIVSGGSKATLKRTRVTVYTYKTTGLNGLKFKDYELNWNNRESTLSGYTNSGIY